MLYLRAAKFTIMKKTSALLLILLTCNFLTLQAQIKFPFPGSKFTNRQNQTISNRTVPGNYLAAKIQGADTIGFGSVPGIVWDYEIKQMFPGSKEGVVNDIRRLSDGNYAATGVINNTGASFNQDMFFVKFTENGKILWKKIIDENPEEIATNRLFPTPDGGFFTIGDGLNRSPSGNWQMIKFNTNGDTAWRRYTPDSVRADQAFVNTDGTILVTGVKSSSYVIKSGFCKDQVYKYDNKIVIFKFGIDGKIIWQKEFLADNGINNFDWESVKCVNNEGAITIIASYTSLRYPDSCYYSYSSVDFDYKSVILQTDSSGNFNWEKKYGGKKNDYLYNIVYEGNSMYRIFGYSSSVDGDLSGLRSDSLHSDAWIFLINSTGQTLYQKIFKNLGIYPNSAIVEPVLLPDTNICALLYTYERDSNFNLNFKIGLVRLDRTNNIKWKQFFDNRDFYKVETTSGDDLITAAYFYDEVLNEERGWISKLGPVSQISGSVFYDLNKNGLKESNEPYCKNFQVITQKINYSRSSFSQNGWFRNDVDTGTYTTTVVTDKPYYTIVPASKQTVFPALGLSDTVHFALQPIDGKQDLSVSIVPLTAARTGFNASYKINYSNQGTTTIANAQLKFVKDARTTFVSGSLIPSQTTGDTILWNIPSFSPLADSSLTIQLKLSSAPTLNNGDTLKYNAFVLPVNADLTPADDTSSIKQFVTGSYDPNDKSENFVGKMPEARYALGDDIQYIIRFQNTGTDTAFNVHIADTLDTNLEWNTMQMIGSSHKYKMTINNGNKVNWIFDNINLPDSNRNEPLSHGFLTFKVKPKSNLNSGDYIQNKAFIYFDYNLPVPTNTVTTTIISNRVTPVPVLTKDEVKITLMPNPGKSNVYMLLTGNIKGKLEVTVIDNTGRLLTKQTIQRSSVSEPTYLPLKTDYLLPGVYYVKVQQGKKSWVQKMVIIQ